MRCIILPDRVQQIQQIIDTFKLLSPENQDIILECAYNILKSENSSKKSADCTPEREEEVFEEGDTRTK
jgi:hypothetical protein